VGAERRGGEGDRTMEMMRCCMATASSGYLPAADSALSITASAPSNTAVATSDTSARVGLGDSIMDSSTAPLPRGRQAGRHRQAGRQAQAGSAEQQGGRVNQRHSVAGPPPRGDRCRQAARTLRRDDDGAAVGVASVDDFSLGDGHRLHHHLHAEVAAGHLVFKDSQSEG